MADTITSSRTLEIGIEYDSADNTSGKRTATIKLPNYSTNVSEQSIKTAFTGQNVIMVNGYGYDPALVTEENIYTAATVDQTINNIDIGWDS